MASWAVGICATFAYVKGARAGRVGAGGLVLPVIDDDRSPAYRGHGITLPDSLGTILDLPLVPNLYVGLPISLSYSRSNRSSHSVLSRAHISIDSYIVRSSLGCGVATYCHCSSIT